jgi:hypothetical protein
MTAPRPTSHGSNPRHHTVRLRGILRQVVEHDRRDGEKIGRAEPMKLGETGVAVVGRRGRRA